ncbi:MAG: YncE family protein [Nocardioides sp.]
MHRPGLRPLALTLGAGALLTACGLGDSSSGPGAAEPATAPPTSQAPAGTVADVGEEPQGIVYDARTRTVAVAVRNPTRILLLDPRTLRTRVSVPVDGKARHLQLAGAGGPVLVPAESADQVDEVALPGGEVRAIDVPGFPHDVTAAGDGYLAAADEFGHSMSVVRDGRVVHTFDDLVQPGGVVGDAMTVAVVDVGAFTLSTYDLRTLRRVGRIGAGAGPTHGVLVSGHRVAVTDTRGERVLIDSLHPLRQVGALSLPGSPYGIAADPVTDTVWVTLTATNQVVGIDVSANTPRVIATYPTVQQPDTVAVAPGARTLWVTGTTGGVVQRISR